MGELEEMAKFVLRRNSAYLTVRGKCRCEIKSVVRLARGDTTYRVTYYGKNGLKYQVNITACNAHDFEFEFYKHIALKLSYRNPDKEAVHAWVA